jgi:hypothetical protein
MPVLEVLLAIDLRFRALITKHSIGGARHLPSAVGEAAETGTAPVMMNGERRIQQTPL